MTTATFPPKASLDLVARYQEGRLIPFLGAGASMAVEWLDNGQPKRGLSWRELVNHAAEELGFDDPDLLRVRGADLQILEYYKLKNNGEVAPLRNWYLTNYNAPHDALKASAIHTGLAALDRCRVFYTTNYDDYLERSLRLNGKRARAVAIEAHIADILKDDARTSTDTVQVVKFHGDLDNPGRMVLSESDYESRLKFAEVEDQRLRSDLLGRAMLFIGYSFRDWNVSYLFRLINEQYGPLPLAPTGTRAYITVADPSDFEYTLFRARNIEVIPVRGDSAATDIAALLGSLQP
jgi:hypothetical protein